MRIIISFFLASLSLLHGKIWIDCSEAFEIAAQTVTVPSPAEIDYKAGLGKEFREALGGRTDINWNAVQDHYREWSEHTTTLSGPARMLVACVLSVVTQGMGTSEWLAGHGIAEGTATNAALSSGIQTLAASAGTALAANLGDLSKAFDELTSADFVKNIASTMLTAGISQSVSTSLQLPNEPKTFTDSLKTNATHGLVRTGVDSAINGGKVGKNLAQTMTSAAVDASSAQIAHGIGDAKHSGALNQVTHKAAHGALAVTSAKLTGRDPVGAVIGAVVAETAAEAMDKPGAFQEARQKIAQKARIIGDTAAFVAGRDVVSADNAGKTAVENNYRGHLELHLMRQDIVNDKSLSDEEKQKRLAEVTDYGIQLYQAEGKGAAFGLTSSAFPTITAGYFASQSAAHWAGTYAGGGIEAVKQEFKDHPILSTLDVAATGMLGAGFVKGMTRTGLQVMSKQPATRVYQPTPEQSALSLQRGFSGNKGSNIKANYEIDRRIPRYDRNTEHIVNGRRYGAHAMDQMQNRGIPPSVVENTITTGQKIPAKDGRLQYYEKVNNITVIAEPNGDIVTVRYGEK